MNVSARIAFVWLPAVLLVIAATVLSGIISLKASTGHWAVTSWMLDLAKRRSVATRSLNIDVPPLDDPSLVRLGARHFEIGCQPCHGRPSERPPVVPARMTPHPPALQNQIARWKPNELFYIVKHGIKFTGMPAWPADGRDDEVWAIVAFLRKMPGLTLADYQRLAIGTPIEPLNSSAPEPVEAERLARFCDRCHGEPNTQDLASRSPRLRGQQERYLRLALDAYRTGARSSGIMQPIAARLASSEVDVLARTFAGQIADSSVSTGLISVSEGASIALNGIPSRGVPACVECHVAADRNPAYPKLEGQHERYLAGQLELFASNRRGGSPYAHIMRNIAVRLTPEEQRLVARYFASRLGLR